MSRQKFIELQGATCSNWRWSWSYVNHSARFVIFGAWEDYEEAGRALILEESWAVSPKGRRSPAYSQAREHVRLVEEEGYALRTFPMQHGTWEPEDPHSPSRIVGFTPELRDRTLLHHGTRWYASDETRSPLLPEELDAHEALKEGAAVSVKVNSYERNSTARELCLQHYGRRCAVCGLDPVDEYGPIGTKCIHVHHLVPIAEIGAEYEVDPIADLVPVCPNCHAVIHSVRPALTMQQVKASLRHAESGIQQARPADGARCAKQGSGAVHR